uniref:Uncharacterized protein n=1 Tax=Physcomitrium patens TaxID=3218 RepID=A0A2K1JZZ2_PHYPA|nr:hypothetical protein PHYPA_014210 [Physcomitrium patens]
MKYNGTKHYKRFRLIFELHRHTSHVICPDIRY